MAGGRPRKYDSAEEMEEAILDYFEPMVQDSTTITTKLHGPITTLGEMQRTPRAKVTTTGLAWHLGFESRQSLYDYRDNGEFSYIIKRALLRIEMSYEERLSEQAVTGAIFALKNMGWKDEVKQHHSGGMNLITEYTRQPGNEPLPNE